MKTALRSILALSLALILVLALFTGCTPNPDETSNGTSEEESNKTEVDSYGLEKVDLKGRTFRILDWSGAPDVETETGALRQARLEEIKEFFNCDIEFIVGTNEIFDQTLYPSILAENPIADISNVGQPAWFMQNVRTNVYYPISDLKSVDLDNELIWNKDFIDFYTYEGKKYALSPRDAIEGQVLFVNLDLLKRCGVTEDVYDLQKNGQWTMDKFLEIAKKCTTYNDDGSVATWGYADDGIGVMNFMHAFGASYFKEVDGKYRCALDTPEALEAFTYYQNLNLVEKVFGTEANRNNFAAGKVAFYGNHPNIAFQAFVNMTDTYGMLTYPKVNDTYGNVSVCDYPYGLFIPSTVVDPEAVGAFATAFYASDPVRTMEDIIDEKLLAWSTAFREERGMNETFKMILEGNVTFDNHYMFVDGNLENGTILPFIRQIIDGSKTPAQAAQELVPEVNAYLDELMGYTTQE